MNDLEQIILAKKAALADAVAAPLGRIGDDCAHAWPDADALDAALAAGIAAIPNCHLLYCWDLNGIELSSMVEPARIERSWRGRDLSQRPYLKNHLPFKGVMLSSVYHSMYRDAQCITALQAVTRDNQLLGFVAADFAVSDLLRDARLSSAPLRWQQFRGDPSVRGTVFMQTRAQSAFDDRIDEALARIEILMREHGVFHSKIHFSSSRCSFWLLDDPYNYRLHGIDEIVNPELCLAYPAHAYSDKAKVTPAQILPAFRQFKALRFADETIYLRSGSLNIMNGLVGLTFSCDGSHYMPVDEFLAKDIGFWVGALDAGTAASA